MLLRSEAAEPLQETVSRSRVLTWLWRRIVASDIGGLVLELPSGTRFIHRGSRAGPEAHLALHSWRALSRLIVGGDIGFAEAFRQGEWSSHDLLAFFAWVTANERQLTIAWRGLSPPRFLHRLRHAGRRNSRAGSRRNISAHYDLGNEFYACWLDAGMQYSSAIFNGATQTLEAAQSNKLQRIVCHLALQPGQRVLEIGCGWGALAERIVEGGASVTGLTLSTEQHRYATRRLADATRDQRADFKLQDYRDATGQYDAVASIEMLEAVGEAYWPVYFKKVHDLMKPGARAVIQVITIAEDRFESYRARPDFIQQYIFPGGMLPTKTLMASHVREARLDMLACEWFGASYAETLAVWRSRFRQAEVRLSDMGYDERFRRIWEYYLAYCETGFRSGALDVGFYVLSRPET